MFLDNEEYVDRYTNSLGISRRRNSSKKITSLQNIRIFYCFGDLDSTIMFSNTVYPNVVSNNNFYNIFLTWNGFEFVNNTADEVWSFNDEKITEMFYKSTNGIENYSDGIFSLVRSLNENFINVEGPKKYLDYFSTNLNDKFYSQFSKINFRFPHLLSYSSINEGIFNKISSMKEKRICLIPFKYAYHIEANKKFCIDQNIELHEEVVKTLCSIGFDVVIIQNSFTLDLSKEIKSDNVFFVKESNFEKIFSIINISKMYIDIFSNSFVLGSFARVPVVSVIDKPSWMAFKKYEDVELFLQKGFYNFLNSFNYFTMTEDNTINKLFVRRIANTVKILYNKNIETSNHLAESSFDIENFCKSKLNYICKKKVFFLRSNNNA